MFACSDIDLRKVSPKTVIEHWKANQVTDLCTGFKLD